ncbi:hypothetical protein IV102_08455 [bacterium]|nr:hypothetical protein [bacterium]
MSLTDGRLRGPARSGCVLALTLMLAASIAGYLWRFDLQAMGDLKARQAAQALLEHPKAISVEVLGQGPGSEERPQRMGWPSMGPVFAPQVNQGPLLNSLQLAFWEHCREGTFPPSLFRPVYAILIHHEIRTDVILFSPDRCALETTIPGRNKAYFVIPRAMSRHIQAQLAPEGIEDKYLKSNTNLNEATSIFGLGRRPSGCRLR